jgi:hypothetical protein
MNMQSPEKFALKVIKNEASGGNVKNLKLWFFQSWLPVFLSKLK